MKDTIKKIEAREILGGSGRPTVEVQLSTTRGLRVKASVPSGTSRGRYEAVELWDGGDRFRGKGVLQAVENVNRVITPALEGKEVGPQAEIDRMLIDLDGTPNKRRLGGNAILAVSLACARAGAESEGIPLFRYLGGIGKQRLPYPIATLIAGGEHSPSSLPFEDYLLLFSGFPTFGLALEALVEIRLILGEILKEEFGPVPEVGGALAPPIQETSQAFDLMLDAAKRGGFEGKVFLGLDVAASEIYNQDEDLYSLGDRRLEADALLNEYGQLARKYPLNYIEDPFHQDDFSHFAELTAVLPGRLIVGDDLFVSNPRRLEKGIQLKAGNGLLLKVNQIGTVSEALEAVLLARRNDYAVTVSLRSNETNDDFIADLAVGAGASQIKLGSPVRGERVAKYNRLLEVELELQKDS
jgi:enolase